VVSRYLEPRLERAPRADMRRLQITRLRKQLSHARAHSPFYRRKLRPAPRLRTLDDLRRLPFTTKDELRRSQEDHVPGEPFGRHQAVPLSEIVQVVSSSGTTGHPLYYALTAADLELWRQMIAAVFFTALLPLKLMAASL